MANKTVVLVFDLVDGPPESKGLDPAESTSGPWVHVTGHNVPCDYAGAVNGGGAAALGRKIHDLLGVRDEAPDGE